MMRNELIKHIKYSLEIGADILLTEDDAKEVIKALEQPEQETGEWLHRILIPNNIDGHMHGECSICHKVRIIDNFCPACGTKMKI